MGLKMSLIYTSFGKNHILSAFLGQYPIFLLCGKFVTVCSQISTGCRILAPVTSRMSDFNAKIPKPGEIALV